MVLPVIQDPVLKVRAVNVVPAGPAILLLQSQAPFSLLGPATCTQASLWRSRASRQLRWWENRSSSSSFRQSQPQGGLGTPCGWCVARHAEIRQRLSPYLERCKLHPALQRAQLLACSRPSR